MKNFKIKNIILDLLPYLIIILILLMIILGMKSEKHKDKICYNQSVGSITPESLNFKSNDFVIIDTYEDFEKILLVINNINYKNVFWVCFSKEEIITYLKTNKIKYKINNNKARIRY
jgi:hypothetical protein